MAELEAMVAKGVITEDERFELIAAYGVREAWVVNANTLATRVLRLPAKDRYSSACNNAFGRRLEPEHASELSLAELALTPVVRRR